MDHAAPMMFGRWPEKKSATFIRELILMKKWDHSRAIPPAIHWA
jgi:hypothetical protein